MTVHVLLSDPPRPGRSLSGIAGTIGEGDAAALHAGMIEDAMVAAERSGGELLVNYPSADRLEWDDRPPEEALRRLAEGVLDDAGSVRYEVQVGGSFAARAGNAATHLLDEEDVASVAILAGTAPTLDRTALDGAAMKLRRSPVVVGPGTGGRAAYLGLTEPIDFEGAFEPPEVETLAGRGVEAGHEVAFLEHHPVVEDEAGLAALVAEVRARQRAGGIVPEHTAEAIDRLGLRVVEEGGERRVVTEEARG